MNTHVAPDSIVVGYDGSEPARHALTWAAEQAALEGRSLAIVRAGGEGEISRVTEVHSLVLRRPITS